MSSKVQARNKAINTATTAVMTNTLSKITTKSNKERVARILELDESERRNMKIWPRLHLQAFMVGEGKYRDWNMLAMRINIGMTVFERFFMQERIKLYLRAAMDVLHATHPLFQTRDRIGFLTYEASDIADALDIIDGMQDLCSRAEWTVAVEHVFTVAGVKS